MVIVTTLVTPPILTRFSPGAPERRYTLRATTENPKHAFPSAENNNGVVRPRHRRRRLRPFLFQLSGRHRFGSGRRLSDFRRLLGCSLRLISMFHGDADPTGIFGRYPPAALHPSVRRGAVGGLAACCSAWRPASRWSSSDEPGGPCVGDLHRHAQDHRRLVRGKLASPPWSVAPCRSAPARCWPGAASGLAQATGWAAFSSASG